MHLYFVYSLWLSVTCDSYISACIIPLHVYVLPIWVYVLHVYYIKIIDQKSPNIVVVCNTVFRFATFSFIQFKVCHTVCIQGCTEDMLLALLVWTLVEQFTHFGKNESMLQIRWV